MIRIVLSLLTALALQTGCARNPEPPLSVSDIRVLAPLPGRTTSVAYMTIHNRTTQRITIDGFFSPGFASAEMHETTLSDGIARMQSLESIAIEPRSELVLAPGGLHIMLVKPLKAVLPGASIRLELRYNDGGLLLMDAPVRTRLDDPA